MSHNYRKLQGKIVEICGSQRIFAQKIGLSERSVSLKLNNVIPFKQTEIEKAIEVLNIDTKDIPSYFFDCEVQNF